MYCKHFDLTLAPFSSTPDPRFFFETPDHEEALASLQFVAQERKGFAMLTGEVGTGKTLVSRMVLSRLPAGARTAVITHSRIGGPELLAAICDEFEIQVEANAPVTVLMHQLERYLLEQYARDRLALVVLDEAQNLPADALEQLRMLGNLEAEDAKLLQVLILGQPELLHLLAAPGMRQLRQRIYRTYHLHGLSAEQTAVYIQHRLNVAGAADRRIFSDEALQSVHKHSNGLPRLVNQICDNAMLTAYSQNLATINASIIREVANHIPACHEQAIKPEPARSGAAASPTMAREGTASIPAAIPAAIIPPPPVEPVIASEGVRYRMADIEAFVKHLSERQSAADKRLEDVATRARSASEERSAAEAFLDQAKTLREQAAHLVQDAATCAQVTQGQIAEIMETARRDTDAMRGQVAELLTDLRARADHLGKQSMDMTAVTEEVESSLTRRAAALAERQSSDAAALRRDLERLAESIERRWAESQQRQEERMSRLCAELNDVRSRFDAVPTHGTGRSHALSGELEKLLDSARVRIDQAQSEFLRTQDSARQELQTAIASLAELRDNTREESAAWRDQMRDWTTRAETLLVEVREQARAAMLDLSAQRAMVVAQTGTRGDIAQQQVGRVAEELARMVNESRQHAQRIRGELDRAVQAADARVADTQAALSAPASTHQQTEAMLREIDRRGETIGKTLTESATQHQQETRRMHAEIVEALSSGREQLAGLVADAQRELMRARAEARTEIQSLRADVTLGAGAPTSAIESRMAAITQAAKTELIEVESRADELRRGMADMVKEAARRVDTARRELDAHMSEHAAHVREFREGVESDMASSGREATVLIERAQSDVRAAAAMLDRLLERTQDITSTLQQTQTRGEETRHNLAEEMETVRRRMETTREELDRLLTAAREETAASKGTLQSAQTEIVQVHRRIAEARDQVAATQAALSQCIDSHAARVGQLQSEATATVAEAETARQRLDTLVHSGIELRDALVEISDQAPQRVETARRDFDAVMQSHAEQMDELRSTTSADLSAAQREAALSIERAQTEGRAAAEAIDRVLTRADSVMDELRQQIARAMASTEERIKSATATADAVSERLEQRVQAAQHEAHLIRDQVDAERARLAAQVRAMEESSGAAVARTAEAVEALSTRAEQTVSNLRIEIDAMRQQMESAASQVGDNLGQVVGRAAEQADQLRTDVERVHADLAERTTAMQDQAAKVLARAEAAVKSAGEQSRGIHAQLRATLSDMTERGTALREQILSAGRETIDQAEVASQALQRTADQAVAELAAQREQSLRETESQRQRLTALQQQAEAGAENVRATAAALLSDAQAAASRVREQAGQMLEKAQAGAEQLGEQAAALLAQSQGAAERFREQANELLRRTEAVSGDLRRQTQTLRDELQNEIAAMRSSVTAATQDARTAHTRSEELLGRTEELTQRAGKLLTLPQEILAEATQRSTDLRGMSKSLETAVTRLAQISKQAEHRAAALTGANQTAEEKASELANQTARVGQLVSVLRQLYQGMDTRIEQLRDRLGMAEEIARAVPREIEDMRAALGDARQIGARPGSARGPIIKTPNSRSAQPLRTTKTKPTATPPTRTGQTLGDVVQKNTRLNAWLRQAIADVEKKDSDTAPVEPVATT